MSKSIFFFGEPQIKVSVRKVRNSKRMSLRVSSITENVVLTAPVNTNHDVLLNFLKSKEKWIRDKLINAVENNKWIPKDVKNRLVKQLSQELVPKKVVDRLRKRMGG
jgi:predicted metal-dependent hydrolase